MAAAPWYLSQNKPGLKHQKAFNLVEKEGGDWYKRGVKTFQATKFRKGACENCGAMTHKKKDCVERPRKAGAAKTGKNIAADELIQADVDLNYDGKRDRYNGFDASDYSRVVDRFDKAEALKQEVAKKKELERAYRKANRADGDVPEEKDEDDAAESSDSDDDAKVEDADAQGFMKVTKRVRSGGRRRVDDGEKPPDSRGHGEVPAQLGPLLGVLRPQDAVDAREPDAEQRPVGAILRRG